MRSIAVVFACFAVLAFLIATGRLLAKQRASGMGNLLLGLVLGLLAAATWSLAPGLRSFESPVGPDPVAEIVFERTTARQYRATLTRLPGGRMQTFVVAGDEWRVDGSTLEWPADVSRLWTEQRHRLDGLSTRYLGPDDSDLPEPSLYSLLDENIEDRRNAHVSDVRLYGPWRPLVDKARFLLYFAKTGIESDPANKQADKAMRSRR